MNQDALILAKLLNAQDHISSTSSFPSPRLGSLKLIFAPYSPRPSFQPEDLLVDSSSW